MVMYSSRIRCKLETGRTHRENAMAALRLVGLSEKHDVICPGEVESLDIRGELGFDLRMLSIAIELVSHAPVIVLDEPFRMIDMNYVMPAMSVLRGLAKRGHTIICSLSANRLDSSSFQELDSLVLLSLGRSIFASDRARVKEFFCSSNLGYEMQPGIELVDFLLDISTGMERPRGERGALDADYLKEQFDKSALSCSTLEIVGNVSATKIHMYSTENKRTYKSTWQDFLTVMERAFYVKTKEWEALQRGFGGSIVLGLLIGFMLAGQGNNFSMCYTYYQTGLPEPFPQVIPNNVTPLPDVANLTSCFFLCSAICFVQPVFNVHFIVNKMQLYRYERQHCRPIVFGTQNIFITSCHHHNDDHFRCP